MTEKQRRSYKETAAVLLLLASLLFAAPAAAAYDGSIDQGADHSAENSMYLYTFEISLDNPCNSKDMDKDAVNELWFDIDYQSKNGCGASGTYRLDLSWKNGRNLNQELLSACFIRPHDQAESVRMKVWVPGLIKEVRVHLNMDGGERLAFTVEGIFLNGYRINTETDYVSSCYYDSGARIACYLPPAGLTASAETVRRDQYNAVFCPENVKEAQRRAENKDNAMLYRYGE